MPFSSREKYEAADREAKYRARVYPRWVAAARMTQSIANTQLALMLSIAADYKKLAEIEEAKGSLL